MGWINLNYDFIKRKYYLKFKPYRTDMNIFRIVKTRQEHTCSICKKKIPKKSYVFGRGWIKLCLECGEKFSNESIKEFKNIIKIIKLNQKHLENN